MKTKFLLFLTLLTIFLVANFARAYEPIIGKMYSNDLLSSNAESEAFNIQSLSSDTSGNRLTIYTSSGKTQTVSIPNSVSYFNSLSTTSGNTVFINDVRVGDKVDRLLENLTFLVEDDYIRDDRVEAIVLLGNRVLPDTYQLAPLTTACLKSFEYYLLQLNASIKTRFSQLPFVTVTVPYSLIFDLAQHELVGHVFLNRKVFVCLSESVPIIKPAVEWHSLEQQFGFQINGSGVRIVVLDTGIDKTHPDLVGKVVLEKNFVQEGASAKDGHGHGTHCASIAAGTGKASNYTYVGVAPGALLMNGKVLSDQGYGSEDGVISGVEWAVNNSADVISMSLGADVNGDGTDPLSLAIDWASGKGVACAVAAGNSGERGMFTVGTPAVAKTAITVGATDKNDSIAFFSSQGLTGDSRLKPDVCAPGYYIVAARANGTSMGTVINTYYTKASGTSMATPHVAGAAALILQVHPNWNSLMVKSALMGNAKILSAERHWRQGAGRIDVVKAVNTTLLLVQPSASISLVETGSTINVNFIVMNVGSTSASVSLSTVTRCDGQVVENVIRLSVNSLNIQAHKNGTVTMTVGPVMEDVPMGWWEGWLNVTSAQKNVKAPYLVSAQGNIEVRVYDVDRKTLINTDLVLSTYPERRFVQFVPHDPWNPKTHLSFFGPPGNYSLVAAMPIVERFEIPNDPEAVSEDNSRSFMIEKIIEVTLGSFNVSISLADVRNSSILTKDIRGKDLIVHSFKQAISGGPYRNETSGKTAMNWTLQSYWISSGSWLYDLQKPITLYTEFNDTEKLSEAFGFFGSNSLFSEVYMLAWKYYNNSIPTVITQPYSDLAKYNVYYDFPERFPQYLKMNYFFDFTSDLMNPGSLSTWPYGVLYYRRTVPAGANATFYLTPEIASYYGIYYMEYDGWLGCVGSHIPSQNWNILPPAKCETGYVHLGNFKFGPYVPGLTLQTVSSGANCSINLAGDIWANLRWPHPLHWLGSHPPGSEYRPKYTLYIDGIKKAEGDLGQLTHSNIEGDQLLWNDLAFSWNVTGQKASLVMTLPSMTIFNQSLYQIDFDLTKNATLSPLFGELSMPLNYSEGETIMVSPKFNSGILTATLYYSFDSGKTWKAASQSTEGFGITCEKKKQLTIKINAADSEGNKYFYYTSPAAYCRDVKINLLQINAQEIIVKITDVGGSPLGGVGYAAIVVQSTASGCTSYTQLYNNGTARISRPIDTEEVVIAFLGTGIYGKQTLTIRRPLGDVNGDVKVDVLDLIMIASSLGLHPGDSNWVPRTDLNGDSEIDVLDLILCVADLGKTWAPI